MGTPLRAAAYSWAAVHCVTRRAVIHIYSVEVEPLELGSVVALCLVTSTFISMSLLSKEGGVGVSGFLCFFCFVFFLPKVYFWCLSYGSYPQSSVYSYSALMD